jgi:hypothetical protein
MLKRLYGEASGKRCKNPDANAGYGTGHSTRKSSGNPALPLAQ